MVRFATIGAPVTEKTSIGHIGSVLAGNFARQIVEFEPSKTRTGTLFINHFEQKLASQREIILVESSALDRSLTASDYAQPQRQRRGGQKKRATSDEADRTHGNLDASHGFIFHLGDNNWRGERFLDRTFVRDFLESGKLFFG